MTATAIGRARETPYGRYAAATLGLMAIATTNVVVRETTYGKRVRDDVAHAVSLAVHPGSPRVP